LAGGIGTAIKSALSIASDRNLPLRKSLVAGVGRAVDLSSSGVLVTLDVRQPRIRVGASVEMSIEWPSRLDGRIPLQLLAVGHVIRVGTFDFAATLEQYDFHTMKTSR
jgi:hypothetical protein